MIINNYVQLEAHCYYKILLVLSLDPDAKFRNALFEQLARSSSPAPKHGKEETETLAIAGSTIGEDCCRSACFVGVLTLIRLFRWTKQQLETISRR